MESTKIRRIIIRLQSEIDRLNLEMMKIKFPFKKFPVSSKPMRSQESTDWYEGINWFEEIDNPTIGRLKNIKVNYLYYNFEDTEIDKNQ